MYRTRSGGMREKYKETLQEFLDSLSPEQKEQMENDRKQKRKHKLATERKKVCLTICYMLNCSNPWGDICTE